MLVGGPRSGAGALAAGLIGLLAAACGGSPTPATASPRPTASTAVVNHVHGSVLGSTPHEVLIATHYGLFRSENGGRTWSHVATGGDAMVAALAKVPGGYVGAFMQMSPGGSMSSTTTGGAMGSMPGMGSMSGTTTATGSSTAGAMGSMSMSGPAEVESSSNGSTWVVALGLPIGASVTNLAASPDGGVIWASINGNGVYRSTNAGQSWTQAIATTALITAIYDTGTSLLVSTADGLDVTPDTQPSLPATLSQPLSMNTIAAWPACATCLVATLAHGGVATSRDGGQTWQQLQTTHSFDNVVGFTTTGAMLLGMVADKSSGDHGLWRSTDSGATWSRVLDQPLVDQAFGFPDGDLLAFQWGITVWRSTDGGSRWSRFGHA